MKNDHPRSDDLRYRKLDTIDGKCGSLLAVTSILLVFISMPPIFDAARAAHALAFKLVFVALLSSCLLALFVLYFKEEASDRFVEMRKYALNIAVCLTAACCVVVALFVAARL
ncbi:MAG TPA: hypothetical protein VLT83_12400 [Opitutaceae bacterium]|nr:hypothetical protein [Opitutaceae bacterium]